MTIKYKLLSGRPSSEEFENSVNENLQAGWQLYGTPFASTADEDGNVVQAMTKKDRRDRYDLPRHSTRNVQVAYHRFTVLKADDDIVALHLLPDPRFGWQGATFRWYHRADASDEFFRSSRLESDGLVNNKVQSGGGELNEIENGGGSVPIVGLPIPMKWSTGGCNSGWLYPGESGMLVQIYKEQFDCMDEISGQLNSDGWVRIGGERNG